MSGDDGSGRRPGGSGAGGDGAGSDGTGGDGTGGDGTRPGYVGDDAEERVDRGRVIRPDAVVLGRETIVPALNIVRPPPNRFTHELTVDEPYWFEGSDRDTLRPDGVLAAGTPVTPLVMGPDLCRVVDAEGIYVDVRRSSLRERESGRGAGRR